jgi:peroxiredoxin
MSKLLLIDTREKPKAIQGIIKAVDEAKIPHESTKLLFGDYMDYNRPSIVIDRKQNIAEIAKNCTREHDRFRAELERAKAANARLIILVEQNRYKDRDKWIHVESIEDIMLWSSPHTTIRGEKVFRVLRSWMSKYDIDVQFCDKRQTGKKILEIIYGQNRNK